MGFHTHQCQGFRHARPGFGFGNAAGAQPKGNILRNRQMRKQRVVLKHHAHIALMRGQRRNIAPADGDLAAIRVQQTCNAAQQSCLAATGRAEQGDEFSLSDRKAQVT